MNKPNPPLGAFIRLARPHLRPMVLGTALGLIAIAAGIGLLSLAGWFLTATAAAGLTAVGAQNFNFFFPSIGVRLFAFARTAARYGERIVSHDATFRILASLRLWFYRRLEPLAPACLSGFRSGDMLNRMVEDIDTMDNLYLRVLSPGAAALLISGMLLAGLWLFDAAMALWTFGYLVAAGGLVSGVAGRLSAETGRTLARQTAGLRSEIVDALQGLPELLVYGADGRQQDTIGRRSRALLASQRKMSHISGMCAALTTALSGAAVLTVLYIGIGHIDAGSLGGPELALVTLAALAGFEAVMPLPSAFQYLGRTQAAARRLLDVVNTRPSVRFPDTPAVVPTEFDLRFNQVRFGYGPDRPPALDGVTFCAGSLRRTAVLGASGSGKSTLVRLLARFWDPDQGQVRIGGSDIRRWRESDLRRHLAVLSQQAHIFNASLRDNLRIAAPDASEADLHRALADAQLLSFVASLPDGLDTWIGEAGSTLSGGQARRLAVARIFLSRAPIWVMDEPTEGLDLATERRLMRAVIQRTRQKTLLLITHRPIDLSSMDRIVILDAGRRVADGTHHSLMADCPAYRARMIGGSSQRA